MGVLNGKSALITGGTSGIGRQTAQTFSEEGARVAVIGRDEEKLETLQEELGEPHRTYRVDVRQVDRLKNCIDRVGEEFDGLDVLFANAGVTWPCPFDQVDEDHLDEQMAINFKGVYFSVQNALPHLEPGSSIVVTTSNLNQMGMEDMSVYAASKAALRSLVRTLTAELSSDGIRVNAVSPGPIETPVYEKFDLPEEELEAVKQGIAEDVPFKRFGEPEEVADVVTFLASDKASYMQGEEVVVDGGGAAV